MASVVRAWNTRTRTPGDAAGDLVDRRGFASKVEKKRMPSLSLKKKLHSVIKSDTNCGTRWHDAYRSLLLLLFYLLLIYFCWRDSRFVIEDVKSTEGILAHYKITQIYVFVYGETCNIARRCIPEWDRQCWKRKTVLHYERNRGINLYNRFVTIDQTTRGVRFLVSAFKDERSVGELSLK